MTRLEILGSRTKVRGGRLVTILTGLAVVASFALPQAHAAGGPAMRPAILNMTGWNIQATGAPTPNAGDGIGPGSFIIIQRSDGTFGCTANFVWQSGTTQYLGAAGHCFLTPTENSLKDGNHVTNVQVCLSSCYFGGQLGFMTGTLATLGNGSAVAYARQNDPSAPDPKDIGHDFGLVKIPTGMGPIRKTVPVWGGPNGSASISSGDPLCLYGNGEAVGETFPTKARAGVSEEQVAGAWYAAIPSAPGDSGAAVVNCSSLAATGILTHLVVGVPSGVAGTTVAQAISMASSDGGLSISLA